MLYDMILKHEMETYILNAFDELLLKVNNISHVSCWFLYANYTNNDTNTIKHLQHTLSI